MQTCKVIMRSLLLAAALTAGTAICSFADSVTVNSSSELATGVGDVFSTETVNGRKVEVWEIDRADSLVLSELDLPYQTYRNLSVGILYPQPDDTYKIGASDDGTFDYAKGAGAYVVLDEDLNAGEIYNVFEEIRFHGDLGGHTTNECLFFLMFRYDQESGPKVWTGDIFLKFVDADELAHLRAAMQNIGTESSESTGQSEQSDQSAQSEQPVQPVPEWKSSETGWWVGYPDGSYLTNAWYQSPSSGLWYYMGPDGYMMTNTQTPDGYMVNAEGVWIP